MQIRVYGEPAPQGSKKAFVRGGRAVVVEQSAKVTPWRNAVSSAAIDARQQVPQQWTGPLLVRITFFLKRPPSAPHNRIYPSVKPDLDKLLRSTLDGISDAGVWEGDQQVVQIECSKRYATADAECAPGALIFIGKAK
jgi:Holliday junction resolvase RusA-like endonuclease